MPERRLTRDERRQQTREQLLDAAAQVFADRGFYHASVDEIAESAGYSKGAVYSNFTSKDDLFLALFDRHFEQVAQTWDGIGKHIGQMPSVNTEDAGYIALMMEQRAWNLLLLEFSLYAARNEGVREQFAGRLRALRSVLQERLEAQIELHGQVPAVPVEYLSWAIFALGIGLGVQLYLDPELMPATLYDPVITQLLK